LRASDSFHNTSFPVLAVMVLAFILINNLIII
jgi:hypothetical protein